MRNFACKASKALFFSDLDFTWNFRNDCVEFIVKQDRGVYGILNLVPCEDGWQMIASMGNMLEIIGDKKALKKVLPEMPVLKGLIENEGSFDGLSILNMDGVLVLGKTVPFEGQDFLDSLTAPAMRTACIDFSAKCFHFFLEMFQALEKNQLEPWRGRMFATFDL